MIMPLQLLFDRLFKRLFWLVMISEAHNFWSKGFPRVLKSHIQEKNVRLLVAITSRLGKMLPFYNKKLRKKLQQEGLKVLFKNHTWITLGFPGVSKWAGTRYFYPSEIVYSTGRNYWNPKISGGQNHKYDRLVEYFS